MSSALKKKSFDYSVVDSDTKSKLIWYAGEIQKHGKIHVESGLEVGRLLSECKELLDGESFKSWVERECRYSVRSAYNYISAFESFGDCATVAHIELSAMYRLAKNESARKAALEMAKRGKTVTQEVAKELIAKHSEKSSDQGKPGGGVTSSSVSSPVEDDPVSSSTAADTESARDPEPETGGEDRSQTEVAPPADSQQSPKDQEKAFREQRCKTVKTFEAGMRALDDMQRLRKHKSHGGMIDACKKILEVVKNWN